MTDFSKCAKGPIEMARFAETDSLVLKPAPNGGWIVSKLGGAMYEDELLGVYGTAYTMIAALGGALTPCDDTTGATNDE